MEREADLNDPKSSGGGGDTPQGSGLNIDGLKSRPKKFHESSRSRCDPSRHFQIYSLSKLTIPFFLSMRLIK